MAASPEAAMEQPIEVQLDLSNFDNITAAPMRFVSEPFYRFYHALSRDKAPVTLMAISSSDNTDTSGGFRARIIRELAYLRSFHHPHIVRIASMRIEDPFSAPSLVVFEGQYTKLSTYLQQNGPLPSHQVRQFTRSLLSALALLHSRELLHQGICPNAVGIDLGGSLKIIRARCIRPLRHHIDLNDSFVPHSRQIPFVAPELFLGAPLTAAFDIWGAACVFVSMIKSEADYPIYGEHQVSQLFEIFRVFGTATEHTWPGVTALPHYSPAHPKYAPRPLRSIVSEQELDEFGFDLLSQMWVLDPSKRITAAQALQHSYFTR